MGERSDEYLRQFLSVLECDISCEQLLEKIRWSGGFSCPRCGCTSGVRMIEHRRTQCRKCRYQVSPTAGTIFHKTHLPLRKWFLAIFLVATDKRGTSALRLQKLIDVSYKTALGMLRKLRRVMSERVQQELSGALLFAEERILGAKQSKPFWARFFIGINNAETRRVRAVYVSGTPEKANTHSAQLVERSNESQLVAGSVSLIKKFFLGTYHRASRAYAQLYLDEFAYRFNRNEPAETLRLLLADCSCASLPVKQLMVKESSAPYKFSSNANAATPRAQMDESVVYATAIQTAGCLTPVLTGTIPVLMRRSGCDNCSKLKFKICSGVHIPTSTANSGCFHRNSARNCVRCIRMSNRGPENANRS